MEPLTQPQPTTPEPQLTTPTPEPTPPPEVPPPAPLAAPPKPRSSRLWVVTSIIAIILLLAAAGGAIYFFLQLSARDTKISDLEAEVATLREQQTTTATDDSILSSEPTATEKLTTKETLKQAYCNQTPDTSSCERSVEVYDFSSISDSPNKPYQTVSASMGNSDVSGWHAVFFRASPKSDWVFAFGGHDAPVCHELAIIWRLTNGTFGDHPCYEDFPTETINFDSLSDYQRFGD
jgi:hypothetical protein